MNVASFLIDAGIIGAALALIGRFFQERKEYGWRKGDLTSNYIREWTEKTIPIRVCLELEEFERVWFKDRPAEVKNPIEFAQSIAGKQKALKDAVIDFMNWCEDWAILYQNNMLNVSVVDQVLKDPVKRYREKIENLVIAIAAHGHSKKCEPRDIWPALFTLFDQWKDNKSFRPSPFDRLLGG